MKIPRRPLIAIALLITTIVLCYALPKPKYEGIGLLKTIELPDINEHWIGEDVKQDLHLTEGGLSYISGLKTKQYLSKSDIIYVTLIDAGNFHHPKACFSGAGYVPEDLDDAIFTVGNMTFKAKAIFFKKEGDDILVIYWMCVNKERVDWNQQKLKSFLVSLFGKKEAGFIVRLDIPTTETNIPASKTAAQDLVQSLYKNMPKHEAEYIFGK